MPGIVETIESPLTPEQMAIRWQALCNDPTFEDVPAKIELTEWGEILMSPVGKTHGLIAMRIAETLRRALGGHTMAEVGVATAIGVRAPDVAWCSDEYLGKHPEEAPLSSAPEICVEVVSASNALPKLREKASAYVQAGAVDAWLAFPGQGRVEIHGRDGQRQASAYGVDVSDLLR